MAGAEDEIFDEAPRARRSRRRWLLRLALSLLGLLAVAIAIGWFSRERIADNVIAAQMEELGLPATYEIERIGGERQILSNIVIGDTRRPDLTIERAEVRIIYRLGRPRIGRITLIRPRLFGSYRDGELSFGSLDRVLFRDTGEPPGLPALDIALVDGRALIESDFGPVGLKVEGEGQLNDGFSGIVAASAPEFDAGGCALDDATLYGTILIDAGQPYFDGPVRFSQLRCAAQGLRLAKGSVALDAVLDDDLGGVEASARLNTGAARVGGNSANGLSGTFRTTWRDSQLDARYSLAARGLETAQASLALLTAEGALRARGNFERIELDGQIEGNGIRPGSGLDRSLAGFAEGAEGSFLEPIIQQTRRRLAAEGRGSALTADVTYRSSGDGVAIVVPQASLRGGSGQILLSLSRGQYSDAGDGAPRFSGNFTTGGTGLPRIAGRMERDRGGAIQLRVRMAEYTAGDASLAIPELVLSQDSSGGFAFTGRALASGALPGGAARNLLVPLSGTYSPAGELALWRDCTEFRFERLEYANLTLEDRELTLCPPSGGAIVRSGAGGLRIAAGAPSLELRGRLGETPIAIRSGPIGFAYPGVLSASRLVIALGPPDTAVRFTIADLDARLGGSDLGGAFSEADVFLPAVPLDVLNASGQWRYVGGRLELSEGAFRLEDRQEEDRFFPLFARDAALTLEDNLITAQAGLFEQDSDRLVTAVDVVHSLETGRGYADLDVPGLLFDEALQPDELSRLALGVVANVRGVVTGIGRVDWTEAGVTSTGRFSSEDLDFAAAFGPVEGASGTVVFTDLLGLTTAPNQRIRVASVNPGIEVLNGEVVFSLRNGQLLALEGASWPFMGGTLTLREVDLNLGTSEERGYIFDISGLDAAVFVSTLELGNISATGTFDGTVPIIFDAQGTGRIEGGALLSRPPGGNISYVGELTYRDLSPIANFAFDALRSLDYRQMRVAMDGNLTGELVTRVRFDGVTQGQGAASNFITRRLAKLPIRFNVNIRAPFYQLITSIKAMYDPAYIRDPRELGLVDADGTRLRREITAEEADPEEIAPEDLTPDTPSIQTPASENMR